MTCRCKLQDQRRQGWHSACCTGCAARRSKCASSPTASPKQGYTVHCPQLAGHCGSDRRHHGNSTWVDWYRSAEDALFELRKDCDVVIAGGLSTGAVLALMLAAKHPTKIQATTLMAPTLWLNGWMIPWYARLFPLVAPQVAGQPVLVPAPQSARH